MSLRENSDIIKSARIYVSREEYQQAKSDSKNVYASVDNDFETDIELFNKDDRKICSTIT